MVKCDQICPWNYYEMGCKKPNDEMCPMSNIATKEKPQTNADRIRAFSDEELAEFLANRFAKEHCHRLYGDGRMLTATQIKAITFDWYCAWMKWLKQPADEGGTDGGITQIPTVTTAIRQTFSKGG